jgi:hypothetical protein
MIFIKMSPDSPQKIEKITAIGNTTGCLNAGAAGNSWKY